MNTTADSSDHSDSNEVSQSPNSVGYNNTDYESEDDNIVLTMTQPISARKPKNVIKDKRPQRKSDTLKYTVKDYSNNNFDNLEKKSKVKSSNHLNTSSGNIPRYDKNIKHGKMKIKTLNFLTEDAQMGNVETPRTGLIASFLENGLENDEIDKDELLEKGIITYVDQQGKNMIYGGTVNNIISQIVQWLLVDPDRKAIFKLVHVFVNCYQIYLSTEELISVINELWNSDPPPGEDVDSFLSKNRSGIMLFLSGWFESSNDDDFAGESGEILYNFINSLSDEYKKPLYSKIENVKKKIPSAIIPLFKPSKSKISKHQSSALDILQIDPSHIAEQWTLLDIRNFMQIKKLEYLELGPNWEKMMKRSALLTRWVATEIVEKSNIKKRVETLKRFISIAVKFLELNNFNGLMCVWGGLNTVYVNRLKKTFKKLPKNALDIISAFKIQLSEENNFQKVRAAINKKTVLNQPCIPWFELISKTRNWISNYDNYVSPNNSNDTEIYWNFGKVYILGSQIINFDKFQYLNRSVDVEDNQDSNVAIRTLLEHLPTYNDEMLWKLSLLCEPNDK